MEIDGQQTYKKVDCYSVGDVIADGLGIYLVCQVMSGEGFVLVDLEKNRVLKRHDSLGELFQLNSSDSDRVLKAKLLIEQVM